MTIVLPVLLATAFLSPALLFGQVPVFRDLVNTFLPYKVYVARALASGSIPLWAPEPSFGAPFLANYQSAILYPPSAIVFLAPDALGVGLYLWLHFTVAAVGIERLLARHGFSSSARVFGAIVYTFGGSFVSTASMWSCWTIAAWMPLTLVAVEKLLERPFARNELALVALFTLQVLGGVPEALAQCVVLSLVVASLSGAATLPLWRRCGLVVVAGALAVTISAVQLAPTLEYFLQTTRAEGLESTEALAFSLDPKALLTLVVPHRLDGGIVGPIVDGSLTLWWSIYVGLIPLLCVIVALPRRESLGWTLLLMTALALAMGHHTPLYPLLLRAMPQVFTRFRYPEKFLISAHLGLAILATIGFARLERAAARGRLLRHGLLAFGLCLVTLADLWDVHLPALLFTDWKTLLASAPPPPLLDAGPEARVFGYEVGGSGLRIWAPRFTVGTDLLQVERQTWSEMAGNVPLVYGIGFVNGLDSFHRRPLVELYRVLAAGPVPADLRALRSLGSRFLLGPTPLDGPGLELLRRGGGRKTWIYRLSDPAPRVYLAKRVRTAENHHDAIVATTDSAFIPGEDAVVDGPPSAPRVLAGGTARIVADSSQRIEIAAESTGEGMLVVGDSFYPGWTASVDDRPVEILQTNGIMRGVIVPDGSHRVMMRYEPRSLEVGLALSLVGLLLAIPASRVVTRPLSR